MRNLAASLVGWILVAIVVWLLFGFLVGTLLWVLRMLIVLAVVGGLLALYLKLKGDPPT